VCVHQAAPGCVRGSSSGCPSALTHHRLPWRGPSRASGPGGRGAGPGRQASRPLLAARSLLVAVVPVRPASWMNCEGVGAWGWGVAGWGGGGVGGGRVLRVMKWKLSQHKKLKQGGAGEEGEKYRGLDTLLPITVHSRIDHTETGPWKSQPQSIAYIIMQCTSGLGARWHLPGCDPMCKV
jgi:hypothetical protein